MQGVINRVVEPRAGPALVGPDAPGPRSFGARAARRSHSGLARRRFRARWFAARPSAARPRAAPRPPWATPRRWSSWASSRGRRDSARAPRAWAFRASTSSSTASTGTWRAGTPPGRRRRRTRANTAASSPRGATPCNSRSTRRACRCAIPPSSTAPPESPTASLPLDFERADERPALTLASLRTPSSPLITQGWPKLLFALYERDAWAGTDVIAGYGACALPLTPGTHDLRAHCFSARDRTRASRQDLEAFFGGAKPELENWRSALLRREELFASPAVTTGVGAVYLTIACVAARLDVSGVHVGGVAQAARRSARDAPRCERASADSPATAETPPAPARGAPRRRRRRPRTARTRRSEASTRCGASGGRRPGTETTRLLSTRFRPTRPPPARGAAARTRSAPRRGSGARAPRSRPGPGGRAGRRRAGRTRARGARSERTQSRARGFLAGRAPTRAPPRGRRRRRGRPRSRTRGRRSRTRRSRPGARRGGRRGRRRV